MNPDPPYDPTNEILPSPIPESLPPLLSEDGLAIATAVDPTNEDEFIYAAIEYDPDAKPPLYKNRRFRLYSCVALVVIAAAAAVVTVYITKSAGEEIVNYTVEYTPAPSRWPTVGPTTDREAGGIREQIETGVLQRNATFRGMEEGDPRLLALEWILLEDGLRLQSNDNGLYQRYVLALLAFSLDSLAWAYCGDHREVGNGTKEYVVESCTVVDTTGAEEEFGVWLSSTPECTWYGVICSSDDVVRGVELLGNDLIGQLPPELSQLRFVQYIALNANCLYGTIPPELGQMPNLLSLELQGNALSGKLPEEFYNATKLQLLNVAMQFDYAYECRRSNGTYVNTLYAMGNPENEYNLGLFGPIFGNQIGRWQSMKGLHVFDNSFTGEISDDIGQLKYLVFLRAHNNKLSGIIPNGIVNLDKLREMYLHTNLLYGDLPPDIGSMTDLEDFRVSENELRGTIPESFYNLTKLRYVWIQDTLECSNVTYDCEPSPYVGFEGSISTQIGNLKDLSQMIVNNNPLNGTLPTQLGLCEKLSVLHIHHTQIGGTVPESVCLLRDKMLDVDTETGEGVFYADCRPNNKTGDPWISCSCCTDCCDHTTRVCVAND